MAKVKVVTEWCISSGNCVDVAAGVFDMNDEGTVVALVEDVDGELREQVERAASLCPVQAILFED
jgi:ferredoxin